MAVPTQQQQMYPPPGQQQQMYPPPGQQQQMYPPPGQQQQQMYQQPGQQQQMYQQPGQQQQQMYQQPGQQQQMYQQPGQQQQMYPPPGQQQQMYQQPGQPMMMGSGPPTTLWPNGVGFTDRDKNPDECSCPPCYCTSMPLWFSTPDFKTKGQQSVLEPNTCTCQQGWKITNGDVMGQSTTFEGKECCGTASMYEPEIHVRIGDRYIGKTVMKCMMCVCCSNEAVMTEAWNSDGVSTFERVENVCVPEYAHWSGDFCGWSQFRYPIFRTGMRNRAAPLAYLTWKYHCCPACHPLWVGVEQMPPGLTQEEQTLLVTMALSKWWRSEQQQQQQQGGQ